MIRRRLTPRQRDALVILAGAPRTAYRLAELLGPFVSPAAARGQLAALERKGYAERLPGAPPIAWDITGAGRDALEDFPA